MLGYLHWILSSIRRQWRYRELCRNQHACISHDVDLSRVRFADYVNVAHHAQITDCSIGKRTSIGRYSKLRECDIGGYCSISWDVTIGAVGHPLNRISSHAFAYRKKFGMS